MSERDSEEAIRINLLLSQVIGMRVCQRNYFRTRSLDDLRASKAAEAIVDRGLLEHTGRLAQQASGQRQTTLGDL